jgi:hypothetical protein
MLISNLLQRVTEASLLAAEPPSFEADTISR